MRLCVHYIVMKKESWALLLSSVAVLISLVTLCVACPHKAELGFDYQGVIVGILSLLVTLLIQNYFLFKRTIEEDTKRIVQKVIEDKSSNLEGLITFVRYIDFYNRHIDEKAIDGFIQAIGKINNSTEKEGLNDILFCLIEITKRYNEKGNTCHIYRGKRSDYLDVLSKVDLEGIEKVKKFISDANELSY